MNPPTFEDVSMETNGHYTTVSPSVRKIRTLKRRKEHEKENSKNQNTKLTRTNAKLEKQIETETAQTKKQKCVQEGGSKKRRWEIMWWASYKLVSFGVKNQSEGKRQRMHATNKSTKEEELNRL